MSRQRSEDARRGRRIQRVSPLLHPPCFQPQSAGGELNHTRNCCQCSKLYIFYLKALAGLKMLTDKSPEKRLEPLQEHLTFPALIYLRWIFCIRDSAFSVMMLVFEWSCSQEAKPGWKLHNFCAGLCLLSIFKNTLDGLLSGERPAEVFSPRFQSIFPSLFSSSCLLLVGRKDVLASEGLILAVIKTSKSLLQVWLNEITSQNR